jgi:hypothetical protein
MTSLLMLGKPVVKLHPEFLVPVNHEIGCNRSDGKPEMALTKLWNENAKWCQLFIGLKIMTRRLLLDSAFSGPGKRSDFHQRLANPTISRSHRDPRRRWHWLSALVRR